MGEGRCRGTRRDGTPCQAPAHTVNGDGWCWAHDPARAEARREARAAGGRATRRAHRLDRLVPAGLKPALALVLTALEEAYTGDLPPARANAVATLAGAAVRLYQVAELVERVEALEAAHEAAHGGKTA